jgi:uncharacterized peroxidase-related enzyme
MAHIKVQEEFPGILSLMKEYSHTERVLNDIAEALLVKDTPTFSKADREMVAGYVSYLNNCVFCSESHGAVADYHARKPGLSRKVWDGDMSPLSDRVRALMQIARKVQGDARQVTKKDVDAALATGATERDVHDTVLIAAAFCMFNRYVDGLSTFAPPRGDKAYVQIGERLGTTGYKV